MLNSKISNDKIYFLIIISAFFKQFNDLLRGGSTYDLFEQWMGAGYVFSKLQAYINLDFDNPIFSNDLNVYDYFGYIFMLPAYIFERLINSFSYDENNLPINDFATNFSSEDAQTFFVLHFFLLIYSFICMHIIYKKLKSLFDKDYAILFIIIIFLIPSFTGHMLFNIKDVPFLLNLFIAKLFIIEKFYFKKEDELSLVGLLKLSLLMAASLLTRINAILFLGFLFFFLIFVNFNNLKIFIKNSILVSGFSFVFVFLFSPSSWQNPIQWLYESIMFQSNHPWTGATLTNGDFITAQEMTGSYLINWYFFKMPLFVHLFFLFYVTFLILKKRNNIIEIYSAIFITINFLLFPILRPTAYDGLRHFLFLIPFISIIGVSVLKNIKLISKPAFNFTLFLILVYGITTQNNLDSYRYTYFNEFTNLGNVTVQCDDVDGCGTWPTDYWGFSGKELTHLLNDKYRGVNLLVCEPRHVFAEYLDNKNFTRIEFKDVVAVDTFYTLSLHRPRQFDSSCEFHITDYRVTCETVEVVSRDLRNTKIIMSYINKCSSGI